MRGAVAQGRQVWNQTDKPKQERYGPVSRDGKYVPYERAPELRLYSQVVGIWEKPVKKPRAAEVQHRIHQRADYREQRHGLRKTVDGVAPFLVQQQQNSRDER